MARLLVWLAILVGGARGMAQEPRWLSWFQAKALPAESTNLARDFEYRLFVPDVPARRPDDRPTVPLVIWLHGYGESGSNNTGQLLHIQRLVDEWQTRRGGFPALMLLMQCPLEFPYWTASMDESGTDMLVIVLQVLESLQREYPIDADRVYVTGVSSGGNGTWALLARRPDLFAAVAPMASAGIRDVPFHELTSIPIWGVHKAEDGDLPFDGCLRTVEEINRAGGFARLTIVPGSGHDCWTSAFYDHDVFAWLMAQRRSHSNGPVPWQTRAWSRWFWALDDGLHYWFGVFLLMMSGAVVMRVIYRRPRRRQTGE